MPSQRSDTIAQRYSVTGSGGVLGAPVAIRRYVKGADEGDDGIQPDDQSHRNYPSENAQTRVSRVCCEAITCADDYGREEPERENAAERVRSRDGRRAVSAAEGEAGGALSRRPINTSSTMPCAIARAGVRSEKRSIWRRGFR